MARRVLIGQFMHETNTFSCRTTPIEAFRNLFCFEGDALIDALAGTNSEVAGFLDVAAREGWTITPTVACFATPGGPVTREAWAYFTEQILAAVDPADPPDAVLLSLHGAMVTESDDDGEGALLGLLRGRLGRDVPIGVALDLHANVSQKMVDYADVLVSYTTFPHVDMRATGAKVAGIIAHTLAEAASPRVVMARRAMLMAAEGGRTDTGPMVGLLERARSLETRPGVLDVSINAGFALADTPETGPSVTVTTTGALDEAREIAEALADGQWQARDARVERYYSVDEAAARARTFDGAHGPLVIADFSDNPGDGAYGDATNLLAGLLDAGVTGAVFGGLYDPQAAAHLAEAGEGARVTLALGGHTDASFGGGPLTLTGEVARVSDGRFVCDGPMWAGMRQSTGLTAVFRVAGVDVLVTSHLVQAIDRQMFLAGGIDLAACRVIALKSQQHFRAAFEPLAGQVILADSGGLASPDFKRLPYRRVQRPIHPLDPM